MSAREYNFDGLIGPTNNFSGLALGNVASAKNRFAISHPKKAALQGLAKMKLLLKLGIKQGIIPPQERPDLSALRRELKLKGADCDVLEKARRDYPSVLMKYSSASAMWTANAATLSPSGDTADRRIHLTPANLISQTHRAIEAVQTTVFLKTIFNDKKYFSVHRPLPDNGVYFDEGAANHMRLSDGPGGKGLEIFVYGKGGGLKRVSQKYPARHSREASQAIVKMHRLKAGQVELVQQNPAVIDQGVFHNDVIAVSNEHVLLYHEDAYADPSAMDRVAEKFRRTAARPPVLIKILRRQLTVADAVRSYFFNSQIVTLPSGQMALIAPRECQDGGKIQSLITEIIAGDNPISQVHFVNLMESMKNGGGPACLRLRVVLTPEEARGVHPGFILNEKSLTVLEKWVNKYYRDQLHINDLGSYDLLKESRAALDDLTRLLKLGPIYPFQK